MIERDKIDHRFTVDGEGRPWGGHSGAIGVAITWQSGPINAKNKRNGAFVEEVIEIAAARLRHYQDSPYACAENARALGALMRALHELQQRTKRRVEKGIEGSHAVDPDAEAGEGASLEARPRPYSSPTLRELFPPNDRIMRGEDPTAGTLTEAMMSEPCVGRSHPKDDGTRATDPADARAAECAYEAIRWHLASRYGIKIPEDADPVLIHAALDGIDKSRRPKPEEAKKLVDTREASPDKVLLEDLGPREHDLLEKWLNASLEVFRIMRTQRPVRIDSPEWVAMHNSRHELMEILLGTLEGAIFRNMDPAAAPRAPLGK